ncbi:MAG: XisI protein [Acidobacteriota bacterium]|nr:XisI protein [Acidobacteriota bacterium]
MADLEKYRGYIEEIILCRAKFKYANSSLEKKPVFDRERDRYLLMVNGFEGKKRYNYALVDVEIRNGKFWIHYDGLDDGVATYLIEKGVPKEDIVLAFYSPEKRKLTEFAVA